MMVRKEAGWKISFVRKPIYAIPRERLLAEASRQELCFTDHGMLIQEMTPSKLLPDMLCHFRKSIDQYAYGASGSLIDRGIAQSV